MRLKICRVQIHAYWVVKVSYNSASAKFPEDLLTSIEREAFENYRMAFPQSIKRRLGTYSSEGRSIRKIKCGQKVMIGGGVVVYGGGES